MGRSRGRVWGVVLGVLIASVSAPGNAGIIYSATTTLENSLPGNTGIAESVASVRVDRSELSGLQTSPETIPAIDVSTGDGTTVRHLLHELFRNEIGSLNASRYTGPSSFHLSLGVNIIEGILTIKLSPGTIEELERLRNAYVGFAASSGFVGSGLPVSYSEFDYEQEEPGFSVNPGTGRATVQQVDLVLLVWTKLLAFFDTPIGFVTEMFAGIFVAFKILLKLAAVLQRLGANNGRI